MSNFLMVDAHLHFENISLIEDTKSFFQELGIEKLNIVSPARLDRVNSNPQAMCFKAMYPDDVYIAGGLDYSEIEGKPEREIEKMLADQVLKLKEIGFDGVKILETKPNYAKNMPFPIDSPVYHSFFAHLEELQLPIFWHVADPEEFWDIEKVPPVAKERGWSYINGTYPPKEDLYRRVDNVLRMFPNLRIVFAHFYFLSADLKRAGKLLEDFPNINLDITPGSEMYYNFSRNPEETRKFFINYQNRIVFGDDTAISRDGIKKDLIRNKINFIKNFLETEKEFSIGSADESFLARPDKIKGIKLPGSVLEKIYGLNFLQIAGDKPRTLNIALAEEECHRIGEILKRKYHYRAEENFGYQAEKFLKEI